jgi:Transposase, Mutator family
MISLNRRRPQAASDPIARRIRPVTVYIREHPGHSRQREPAVVLSHPQHQLVAVPAILRVVAQVMVKRGMGEFHADQQRDGFVHRAGLGVALTTIKTTAGPVTLQRPKLRGTTERFASQLFGTGVLRTNALEALVIASFVRGLSVRDVEATLVEALGEGAAVSKSAVSRVCAELKTQFETWSRRDISGLALDYLFLDASHFKYHANAGAEPVLAAWASTPTASRCSSARHLHNRVH